MVRRCNLVEVKGDGVASLCEFACLCEICSLCELWCLCEFKLSSRGAPLVALYMQPVRIYKYFLPSTPSRSAGHGGLRVSFERASSLTETR
jgi:hypothetical protein